MTSLKSKFVIPALLAGSALVSACSDVRDANGVQEDLAGLTDSIAGACPVYNATGANKLECATVAKEHAKMLVNYAPNKAFNSACTFNPVPTELTPDMQAIMVASDAGKCLAVIKSISETQSTEQGKAVAAIAGTVHRTMTAGVLTP